jgi:hypothetical protein
MMSRGIVLTVAALTIGLLQPLTVPERSSLPPGLALAEEMNFTVEGKISQHVGNKLTLNAEGNIIFHVIYNDKTEIKNKDGGPGSPKDLQVGTRIHVDGDLQESGEIIAQRISIQSDSAGEKR